MATVSSVAPGRNGPRLSGRTLLLLQLSGWLCAGVTGANIFVAFYLPGVQCPPSTFKSSLGFSALGLTVGVCGGTFALLGLLTSLLRRFNLINYADPSVHVPAGGRKHSIWAIGFSLALFGCIAISINNFGHYSCLMPAGVIIRSGYLTARRHLAWDDLVTVRARCEIARVRGRAPYPASVLVLGFNGGEVINVGLGDGPEIDMQVFHDIRERLQAAHFYYELDASVTATKCPSILYGPLLNFRGG